MEMVIIVGGYGHVRALWLNSVWILKTYEHIPGFFKGRYFVICISYCFFY